MIKSYYRQASITLLAVAFGVVIGGSPCFASGPHLATLIKKDGGRASGSVRYLASSKVYEVSMKGRNARQQVSASQVARVILKKQPAGLSSAIANVKRGSYASAIPVLKKIKTDYEMFGPDVQAAQYLAVAYLKMEKTGDAIRMCKDVLISNPDAINNPEFAGVYWDALLKEKKYATLKRILDDVIQTGPHNLAAVALVKRGDVLVAQGDAKAALLDGYLRTILMFRDVKSVRPEALYKAIKAHESVGEHQYAERWRKLLLSGYPSSEYAKKLQ
jgi:tetratricopeptide (TPR) repeat protein